MRSNLQITEATAIAQSEYTLGGMDWEAGPEMVDMDPAGQRIVWLQFPIEVPVGAVLISALLEVYPNVTEDQTNALYLYQVPYYEGDLSEQMPVSGVQRLLPLAPWTAGQVGPESRFDLAIEVEAVRTRPDYASGDKLTLALYQSKFVHGTPLNREFFGFGDKAPRLLLRYVLGRTGRVAIALEDLIADSTVFRAWTESADRTEALEYIYTGSMPVDAIRPCVLIDPLGEELQQEQVATNCYMPSGAVNLRFFADAGTGIVSNSGFIESPDKEHLLSEITDRVGGVLEDVVRLGSVHGPGGYLCVQRAQLQGKLELESRSERSLLRRKQSVINAIQPARIEFGIDSY